MKFTLTQLVIICLLLSSCRNKVEKTPNLKNNKEQKDTLNQVRIEKKTTTKEIDPSLFIGTWTENINDNSLFTVDQNFITYVENTEIQYPYKIKNDTLIINYTGYTFTGIISKLKKNQLKIQDLNGSDNLSLLKVIE